MNDPVTPATLRTHATLVRQGPPPSPDTTARHLERAADALERLLKVERQWKDETEMRMRARSD